MFNQLGRKHPLRSILVFIFILSLPLFSCGDHHRPARPAFSETTLTVGVPVNDVVVIGGFNGYVVSVIPGQIYKISITNVSDDADLLYFATDSTFTAITGCNVDNTAIKVPSPEDCIVVAPADTVFFGVNGSFLQTSSAVFTVDVEQLAITDLTVSLPKLDSTTQTTARVYALPVTPGSPHTIAMTGLDDDADLYVFNNDTLTSPNACTIDNTLFIGTTPEDCTLTAAGDTIFFIVDGIFSTAPTVLFTAFGAPAPALPGTANQGSIAAPASLTLDTLQDGQIAFQGTSFYVATGLTAGARYTVSINGLTNNANLTVFNNDSTFTTPATCSINNTLFAGTTPEDCTLTASGSSIFFTITANTTSGGVAFITLVEPGP